MRNGKTAVVRGGGDLATGIIYRLWRVGYSVLALETAMPKLESVAELPASPDADTWYFVQEAT